MTRLPAGRTEINRYLLPWERSEIIIRRHPAVLVTPAAEAFGALSVALILNGALVTDLAQRLIVWIPAAFLIAQSTWTAADWFLRFLVVTSGRVLFVGGLGRRTVQATPLSEIKDLALDRTAGGRLLGFGTLSFGLPGRTRVLCNFVPYPEQLYLAMCGLIYPSGVSADDDHDEASRDNNAGEGPDIG
ncbi:MAG TPA: PH domain-containing protein [Streptosporangiaceae bacterium]|jgi:hypothetical protein